jgi:RHS repeat-associated protein
VWSYAYNGLGQRVRKTGPTGTTLYAYDEAGHLQGEYDGTGKLIQETVWLDDLPVATLRYPTGTTSGPATLYHVHADHLGTPRRVTRPADNQVMWQWESEPFGNTPPEQNPQGQGSFVYNLRFPGQVQDAETGLYYNYFRDYDPGTGRYTTFDPLGLAAGINGYVYVDNAPTMYSDPEGLMGSRGNPKDHQPGFIVHGNWCGPDWTGGRRHPYQPAPGGYYLPPTDYTDAACDRHDKCFAMCRYMNKCDRDARSTCMASCNADLANAQRLGAGSGTSVSRSVAIWTGMQFSPDSGPNDASCPCEK